MSPMAILRIVLLAGFFAVLTLIALESVRRQRMATLVPAGQYRLRMFIAALLLIEIGIMLAGTFWFSVMSTLHQALFLALGTVIALIIVVAGLFDARLVLIHYLIEKRNIYRYRPRDDHDA